MHIVGFNEKILNRYTKIEVDRIFDVLKKIFEQDISINIIFVNKREIRRLNREFRKHDNVTDVLSFPLDNINEIYICPGFVAETFKDEEYIEEIVRLTIHGILHLLGYGHIGEFKEGNEEEFFKIQEEYVEKVLSLLK